MGAALAACGLGAQEPAGGADPVPDAPAPTAIAAAAAPTGVVGVYVIPVHDQIADPVLFVIRRGLKEATDRGIKHVVLDMKTPGGALDTTLKIMETLDRFEGTTATYVNNEALSAGAFIASVTDEIWFAPGGVIGAAAPVLSTGGEIDESMKQKIVSYLRARVRAASEGKGTYRGEVISAMIDANYELKIGEEVLKPKGELLSLTDTEAARAFGDPAQPLLSAGTAGTLDALLTTKFGRFEITRIEITWSERLAQYLTEISPLLLGLGLLALFIEFKTPGFGVFGITGIVLLAIVFLSSSIAGLAGNEPILVFGLGLLLVAAEIFFFPGLILPAVLGVGLMFGSLVWALADIWPGQPVEFTADTFLGPLGDVMMGIVIAIVGAIVLARVIPRSLLWDRLVLNTAMAGSTGGAATAAMPAAGEVDPLIGKRGRAVTDLFPSGEVEIDGRRFAAQLDLGFLDAGEEIVVTGRGSFGLNVERPKQ